MTTTTATTAPATITVPVSQARALTDALAALDLRVNAARDAARDATARLHDEEIGRNNPEVVADLRTARTRAFARLDEAQEAVATAERFLPAS